MKNTCKTYEENGIKYRFDSQKLLVQVNQRKHYLQNAGKKVTKALIMDELAEKCYVTVEAIKNWMYGYNGPSEMEQVKVLADYFEIDYHQLLKEEEIMTNGKEMTSKTVNEAQAIYTKDRIREIYQGMLAFVHRGREWYYSLLVGNEEELLDKEYQKQVLAANAELRAMFNNIAYRLENSMLDIPQASYEKIYNFLWTELDDYVDLIASPTIVEDAEKGRDPEDEDYYDLAMDHISEFLDGGYNNDLRELFREYIVS